MIEENNTFPKLILLVDKLRDLGLDSLISLPRIVVYGIQSSGKSSLLESIVGLNFLPRGSGVCTRRPLELRLVKTPNIKPYGVFEKEDKTKKYEDFDEIRKKIEFLTDKICGTSKNIIDDPIILKIYSPYCPDLTLIDLPGITRIPIGDQPKNIFEITNNMAAKYCTDPRTIILVVIPANVDMTTSETLSLVKNFDEKGERTLGVITKIDIMDKGTNARNMILNKEVPLKWGYIAVKGRTQEDIINKVRVNNALKEETDFFKNQTCYADLPKSLLGTKSLVEKLTLIMNFHIKKNMPKINSELEYKLKILNEEKLKYGESLPEEDMDKLKLVWDLLNNFVKHFKSQLLCFFDENIEPIKKELLPGSKINKFFNDLFNEYIYNFKASSQYRNTEIENQLKIYQSFNFYGFISNDAYISLISPILKKLEPDVFKLQNLVNDIINKTGLKLISKFFSRFLNLETLIRNKFLEVLSINNKKCIDLLKNIIEIENCYLFTKDPIYLKNIKKEKKKREEKERKKIQEEEIKKKEEELKKLKENNNNNTTNNKTNNNKLNNNTVNNNTAKNIPNNNNNVNNNNTVNNIVNNNTNNNNTPNNNTPNNNIPNNNTNKDENENKLEDKKIINLKEEKKKMMKLNVEEIKIRMDNYFHINVKQLADLVPKIVGKTMILDLLDSLNLVLFQNISNKESLSLVEENINIKKKRDEINLKINTLSESKKVLKLALE